MSRRDELFGAQRGETPRSAPVGRGRAHHCVRRAQLPHARSPRCRRPSAPFIHRPLCPRSRLPRGDEITSFCASQHAAGALRKRGRCGRRGRLFHRARLHRHRPCGRTLLGLAVGTGMDREKHATHHSRRRQSLLLGRTLPAFCCRDLRPSRGIAVRHLRSLSARLSHAGFESRTWPRRAQMPLVSQH